jgi:DHA1 family bicyclomycin/chloramphenicol resistance-like MFS transporter
MTTTTSDKVAGRVGRREFVVLMACTMALTALSIDLMLPAFDEMRADFGLAADSTQTAQTITFFFFGMALAHLVFGPAADRFGRKRTMYVSLVVFTIGAIGAATAGSLSMVLLFRFIWGFGSGGPRVLSLAIIRDIYAGDRMAKVMSFIAAVFILVPVIAPAIGALLLEVASWRFLFWVCAAMAGVIALWLTRLPETLDPANRIDRLSAASLFRAARIVVTNRQAVGYTVAATAVFGAFLSYLATSELVWEDVYGRGDQFPYIFGGLAAVIGIAMLMNGRIVDWLGARRIIHIALIGYVATSAIAVLVALSAGGSPDFWVFLPLLATPLLFHGLLIPNMNSLAMEPLGEVAGTASALIGTFAILVASILGTLIDQLFDGTVTPMIAAFFAASLFAFVVALITERGKLFGET